MYINFNGHQNRQKLRKETQYLRNQNIDKREDTLPEILEKTDFPKVSEDQLKASKRRVNDRAKRERKKEYLFYIIFGIIALIITLKLFSLFM